MLRPESRPPSINCCETRLAAPFVERFRASCLFTVERSPDGTATVQITHEALLAKAHWQPLEEWFDAQRELLRVKGRLAVAARLWDKSDRSNDLLLPSGQQLLEVRQLMTAGFELSPVESEFFTLSARRAQRNVQLKAGHRRLDRADGGLSDFAWIANDLRMKANHQEALASRAKKQTDVINKFLVDDLLAAARPEEMGKDVPMRTVVDKAAKKVETSFVDQPEQEAAVRLAIGETYRSLSLHAEAEKHLRRALAIRRTAGSGRPRYAESGQQPGRGLGLCRQAVRVGRAVSSEPGRPAANSRAR